MERQDFEDSWKKAFEGAEVPPSGHVWTNIELDLERANGSKLKKRLAFFQLLAAASIIFSLGVGAGVFIMKNSYDDALKQIAAVKPASVQENTVAEPPLSGTSSKMMDPARNSTANNPTEDRSNSFIADLQQNKASNLERKSGTTESNDNSISQIGFFGAEQARPLAFKETEYLPPLIKNEPLKLNISAHSQEEQVADPVQLMLAKLDQREREVRAGEEAKNKRTSENEKLWTSVGFAAGSYNRVNGGFDQQPMAQQSSASALRQSSSIAEKEAKASGFAYSIGANIGTKISDRWVFQGGVNYLTQTSDYTAQDAVKSPNDAMSFRPASINELKKISASDAAEENVVNTAPYNVNNSLRYLSIPMQAGFLLVNKNFGLQLNAGVSTDIFLQNTVSADGGSISKTSDDLGDNSSYRPVNLSGLAGTELSYRFSKNYRIALNPGVRYPFNSIYRSDANVTSTPITFDIGLRFRYIFH